MIARKKKQRQSHGSNEVDSVGVKRCEGCGQIILGVFDKNGDEIALIDLSNEAASGLADDLQMLVKENSTTH